MALPLRPPGPALRKAPRHWQRGAGEEARHPPCGAGGVSRARLRARDPGQKGVRIRVRSPRPTPLPPLSNVSTRPRPAAYIKNRVS